MKRTFDIILVLVALLLGFIPLLIITIFVKMTSPGPALYWSERIGRDNAIFRMPKFRTMQVSAPAVATHLLVNPDQYLTSVGGMLRKLSLDELPQLFSILKGNMSFVGPRPALYNQHDLIAMRTGLGIHKLTPGLTGWAQINGRDAIPIPKKVEFDAYYLENRSLLLDFRILLLTILKVLRKEGVSH